MILRNFSEVNISLITCFLKRKTLVFHKIESDSL